MGEVSGIVGLFIVTAGFIMVKDIDSTAVFGIGSCPRPIPKADIVLKSYLGTWYEYERYDNWFERNLRCVFAQYTDVGDGVVRIRNGGIDNQTGMPRTVDGTAQVLDPSRPAELKVRFSRFDVSSDPNYVVLDTDYLTYAVVFSCLKLPLLPINMQTAWILTRARGVPPINIDALRQRLEAQGIGTQYLKRIDQTNCD